MNEPLIQQAGEIRLRGWSKRYWRDCPKAASRVIHSYLEQGWDLVSVTDYGKKQTQFELEKCNCTMDSSTSWHHSKYLSIADNGKVLVVRNGKSYRLQERK